VLTEEFIRVYRHPTCDEHGLPLRRFRDGVLRRCPVANGEHN